MSGITPTLTSFAGSAPMPIAHQNGVFTTAPPHSARRGSPLRVASPVRVVKSAECWSLQGTAPPTAAAPPSGSTAFSSMVSFMKAAPADPSQAIADGPQELQFLSQRMTVPIARSSSQCAQEPALEGIRTVPRTESGLSTYNTKGALRCPEYTGKTPLLDQVVEIVMQRIQPELARAREEAAAALKLELHIEHLRGEVNSRIEQITSILLTSLKEFQEAAVRIDELDFQIVSFTSAGRAAEDCKNLAERWDKVKRALEHGEITSEQMRRGAQASERGKAIADLLQFVDQLETHNDPSSSHCMASDSLSAGPLRSTESPAPVLEDFAAPAPNLGTEDAATIIDACGPPFGGSTELRQDGIPTQRPTQCMDRSESVNRLLEHLAQKMPNDGYHSAIRAQPKAAGLDTQSHVEQGALEDATAMVSAREAVAKSMHLLSEELPAPGNRCS